MDAESYVKLPPKERTQSRLSRYRQLAALALEMAKAMEAALAEDTEEAYAFADEEVELRGRLFSRYFPVLTEEDPARLMSYAGHIEEAAVLGNPNTPFLVRAGVYARNSHLWKRRHFQAFQDELQAYLLAPEWEVLGLLSSRSVCLLLARDPRTPSGVLSWIYGEHTAQRFSGDRERLHLYHVLLENPNLPKLLFVGELSRIRSERDLVEAEPRGRAISLLANPLAQLLPLEDPSLGALVSRVSRALHGERKESASRG